MMTQLKASYVDATLTAVQQLETELQGTYGDMWRLRIERESPGVWRCRWDVLGADGAVVGGGSESYTITLADHGND
jgi:methionine-rich copper-binding protein CopC